MKTKSCFIALFLAGFFAFTTGTALAGTFYVTNTLDAGAGSLRQAIINANANADADVIEFAILPAGNTFESSAGNSWAVIQLVTALPVITNPVYINGATQPNTNLGVMPGKVVGVDNLTQPGINYPDVYIVPASNYAFPNSSTGTTGNGLTINALNVTVRGLAISGFGNTSLSGGTVAANGEILFARSNTARTVNFLMYDCFLSSDPRGAYPALAHRRSKSSGFMMCGNNNGGVIRNNYVGHSGSYGIHFNGLTDNSSVGPTNTLLSNLNWIVQENIIFNISRNTAVTSAQSSDGITTGKAPGMQILRNYVEDAEQVGIDLGWNADNIYVENNTITGFLKTTGVAPQAGIRISLCSENVSLVKNRIFNNTGSKFLGGIWIDELTTTQTGMVSKNNSNNYIYQNEIYNNSSSGVVISTNGNGGTSGNRISQNKIYNNTGLGIDLNFQNLTGAPLVTVNDDGDADGGVNNLQNFPMIDSVKLSPSNNLTVFGKCAPGAVIEFFVSDGGANNHGGLGLHYGEGIRYVGTATEGSAADSRTGTGSYNVDGNTATGNVNLFRFTFSGITGLDNLDQVSATATVSNNTSEFGPKVFITDVLGCNLFDFAGQVSNDQLFFTWSALCDGKFSHFVLEQSPDAQRFSTLGTVRNIRFNESSDYSYNASSSAAAGAFFRLKMVDLDGKATYSKVLRLGTGKEASAVVKITPNPFTDYFVTEVKTALAGTLRISVSDESGRKLLQREFSARKGTNSFILDNLGYLPKGSYVVSISGAGLQQTEKIIKR